MNTGWMCTFVCLQNSDRDREMNQLADFTELKMTEGAALSEWRCVKYGNAWTLIHIHVCLCVSARNNPITLFISGY